MWLLAGILLGVIAGLWLMGGVLFKIGFAQGYWEGYRQYDLYGSITTAVRMEELSKNAWEDVCVYMEVYDLIRSKLKRKKY